MGVGWLEAQVAGERARTGGATAEEEEEEEVMVQGPGGEGGVMEEAADVERLGKTRANRIAATPLRDCKGMPCR